MLLNVGIVEAKELEPKDINGLSDPFCTIYLKSQEAIRRNTTIKKQTLNPMWGENISLPVAKMLEDVLCIECWDFDPAETVREKVTKLGDFKGVSGLKILMKEIANSNNSHNFIGSATIPLVTVPALGQSLWCNLKKEPLVKRQGLVKVRLSFSPKEETDAARQNHQRLLQILLLHELKINEVKAYQWNGQFSNVAEMILRQHLVQNGLNSTDDMFAKWIAFSSVHINHHLCFQIFADLAKNLTERMNNNLLSDQETKIFWDAAKRILQSCFHCIKNLKSPDGNLIETQLEAILKILQDLSIVQQTQEVDIFPSSICNLRQLSVDGPTADIRTALRGVITQSSIDWLVDIVEKNKPADNSDEEKLKHHIKIVELVNLDQQKAFKHYEKHFDQIMMFPYSKMLYITYENKISDMCEPLVTELCQTLQSINFEVDRSSNSEQEQLPNSDQVTSSSFILKKALFRLYLELKSFQRLGTELCPGYMESLQIKNYHTWFQQAVSHWLDIEVHRINQAVKNAVKLDKLKPVYADHKHSSSATDLICLITPIEKSLQQLDWPEIEESCLFTTKVINEICECCSYYIDIFEKKIKQATCVETLQEKELFYVTKEWCLAINNIHYLIEHLRPFLNKLLKEDKIEGLANSINPTAVEECHQTLQKVVKHTLDTVKNKTAFLMELVANQMGPSIRKLLGESVELNHSSKSLERLIDYLDDNLITLHSQLNVDDFNKILNIVWDKLIAIISDLVEDSKEKKPPVFFENVQEFLKELKIFFHYEDLNNTLITNDNSINLLSKLEESLSLFGMETKQLIHEYYKERLKDQQEINECRFGILTVRLQLLHDSLQIEVLNGRNLLPMDKNGSSDPYVKIHLLPEEKFKSLTEPKKTSTHYRNLFPLFDEKFSIKLTQEEHRIKDAMVYFIVKDKDCLTSDFIGEAFYPFSDILETTGKTKIEEMPQILLGLSKPKLDLPAMKALELRRKDKVARDFIKKQKANLSNEIIKSHFSLLNIKEN